MIDSPENLVLIQLYAKDIRRPGTAYGDQAVLGEPGELPNVERQHLGSLAMTNAQQQLAADSLAER